MQYIYTDITITPYSEMASDVLTAMLGDIGFDSFGTDYPEALYQAIADGMK